jgi:hypothetical protein
LAIHDAGIIEKEWQMEISIVCGYEQLPNVMNGLKSLNAEKQFIEQSERCRLLYWMSPSKCEGLLKLAADWQDVQVETSPLL